MNRRQILFGIAGCGLCPVTAQAQLPDLPTIIPGVRKVGEGRLTVLMMPILDATLFGAQGRWQPEAPFALSARSLRSLEGDALARRAIGEMRSQGFRDAGCLARWEALLSRVMPSVQPGETLTAVFPHSAQTRFYHNERFTGAIDDVAFAKRFSGICLSPQTSQPALRRALLGIS